MAEESHSDYSEVNSFIVNALADTLHEDTFFKLEPRVLTALEVVPPLRADYYLDTSKPSISSRSDTTIFAVLNKCRTISGQRLLAYWLCHPLKNKDKIENRQDIVQFLADSNELRSRCYDEYLRKVPDLLKLSYKFTKEKCNLNDLVKIYESCRTVKRLCDYSDEVIVDLADQVPSAIKKLFNWLRKSLEEMGDFETMIDESIDVNTVDETGQYMLKPSCDEDIARISLDISNLCDRARSQLAKAADDIDLEANKTIKLEIDPDKGFMFKVTKNNEPAVRGNSNYQQVTLVKKDGYRFTDKTLSKLSNKYVDARAEYNQLARRITTDIISKATIYDSQVLTLSMSITVLDTFVGLAVAGLQNNYVKPLILDSSAEKLVFERLRHPCIENQPDIENYVPNDASLCKDDKKFFMVTGPNMGGKSTFIKAVAVGALMALCGSMVPADDARVSVLDGIYTRVGAGDRQMEGISTFMEEMLDMSTILKSATKYSLVIIDELGRGTSTFDGFGLAWSISKELAATIGSYGLFATHFHELTEMEEEVASVGNLHVRAHCQDNKLTMLYNVCEGVCDESYGINVSRFTKFPEHVIETAQRKLDEFEKVPGFEDKDKLKDLVRLCVKRYGGAESRA